MRITESRLRSVIRSVILENETISLNESILSSAKEKFKLAVKKLGDLGKDDINQHMKNYPEYIEARTGVIKKWKAKRLCKEYFQFAKNNNFDKGTQGKFHVIKWLRSCVENNSSNERNYELFLERLYSVMFGEFLEMGLIHTESSRGNTYEAWDWDTTDERYPGEIQYGRGAKKAKFPENNN
tara:strand:+ start:69 stop:614 length:546 start_codon:yes stop_codon:yes gene_type:complete